MTVSESENAAALASSDEASRLPVWKLLAFTMATFIAIVTETVPVGLLQQISEDLQVTEAMAGQMVTVFAAGALATAIPVVALTRGLRRKPLFLLSIFGFMAFNSVTALSTHYGVTLLARFAAGMAAGLSWGLLAGYVRRLVPFPLLGRALAVAGMGQPAALSLGVPLGTTLGGLVGWQGVFWIMSFLSLLLAVWFMLVMPDFPGQSAHERQPVGVIVKTPGLRPILFVLFAWILAHNLLYTYIVPFLARAGLSERADMALLVFGLSSVAGLWATGVLVDRWLRILAVVSLSGFVLAALVLEAAGADAVATCGGIVLWGVSFGGAPVILQTALVDAAGKGADVAQSLFVSVFNIALASGGIAGGVLLERWGAGALPWALFLSGTFALLVVWSGRDYAFRPGYRKIASS